MRVIGVMAETAGGPESLAEYEVAEPELGADMVLIRVHAATVNPTDTYVRNGARLRPGTTGGPFVPGMDVAGVVVAVGAAVPDESGLRQGDEVMAIVRPRGSHGGYSERLCLPWRSVVHMPARTTLEAASTLPMNGLTARLTLDLLALPAGSTLLVTGAAGCYGGYVVQLAKHDGLFVIADAAPGDRALVEALGAHVVVDRGPDLASRIRQSYPAGVDAVADGAVMNEMILDAVRDRGGIATVRSWSTETPRGIAQHSVIVSEYLEAREKLDELRDLAERGVLTLRVAATYPASQAAEAHRRLEAGGTRGRLVLAFA